MPGYQLVWRRQDGTLIEVELSGPGPEDQCRAVIAALRKDSRVLSVNVEHD
jgi:ABC-type sulfate transport system substrate-binding protein